MENPYTKDTAYALMGCFFFTLAASFVAGGVIVYLLK